MHPAFRFGLKNGPSIPLVNTGLPAGSQHGLGNWISEIAPGQAALIQDGDGGTSNTGFSARWADMFQPNLEFSSGRGWQNDDTGQSGFDRGQDGGGEAESPLKILLNSLFENAGAEQTTAAASGDNASNEAATDQASIAMDWDDETSGEGLGEGSAGASEFISFVPVIDANGVLLHDAAACPCPDCGMRDEVVLEADAAGTEPTTTSDVSSAPAMLGDMADYLTSGYWTDAGLQVNNDTNTVAHNLGSTGADPNNGKLYYNISGFSSDSNGLTEDRKVLVREVFKLYEATLGIDFEETTSTSTSEVDFFFSDNDGGAYAYWSYYTNGELATSYINVDDGWSGGTSTYNDYTLQTIFHEVGHALGLGHQGFYNGTADYGVSNNFENDSWQASMMSYFSQGENTSVNASSLFLQTPMTVDWMALDDLYGSQGFGTSNAFTENTTWGFNTTVTSDVSDIWSQWST